MVQSCMDYVNTLDPELRERIYASVPADVGRDPARYDKMLWYPVRCVSSYYEAIASVTDGSEAAVLASLQACGRAMAHAATNSFLRLLMRIMNPGTFAKKLGDFWERDHKCGRMEGDVSEIANKKLIVRLTDIAGYTHTSAIASGFGSFALEAMGMKNVTPVLQGWSLRTPAPESAIIHLTWS
jgi:hypothetical protein